MDIGQGFRTDGIGKSKIRAIGNATDNSGLAPFETPLNQKFGHRARGIGARPAHIFDHREHPRHGHVVVELGDDGGRAALLEQDIGLAAAGPVGQPIDLGGKTPGAKHQKGIDALGFHEGLDLGVARGHLGI